MFEIDRVKFGAFVAELRKEKGLTQKELAEKINISDKAVSKWETGNSIPDISLLVPLAEILGVSVTELLECRRMEIQDNLDKVQTDHLIKKAIELSAEENDKIKRKNFIVYLLCAFFSIVSNFCIYRLHRMGGLLGTFNLMPMMMVSLFAIGFGAYFWIFIKDKLPSYYDENDISVYVDGVLHMNMPGVVYNNYNWPHIVKVLRGWSVFGMVFFPMVYLPIMVPLRPLGIFAELPVLLGFILGGLFIPVYIVARKHQYADNPPPAHVEKKRKYNWIWILILVGGLLLVNGIGGFGTIRSGTRIMFFSNEGRDYWNAEYQYFDGFMQRTLWMEEPDVLHVGIETDEGNLKLVITDENGEIIYSEENVETKEFELEVSGKVSVFLETEGHKGGFTFE